MKTLKSLVQENTPFAVMQYFESLKTTKQELNKQYELIYINSENEIAYKILKTEEINYLKNNLKTIKLIIKNKDGKIFEFNNFKNYKESLKIKH
jgi:hypothetical protein